MAGGYLEQAIELLEKANADLEPELLAHETAKQTLDAYARAERLAAFGVAALSRKIADRAELARVTGSSMGKARKVVDTGRVMATSDELSAALQHGEISLDQATEIAAAEDAAPGSARALTEVAKEQPFHVLKEKARLVKLEAEQHRDLAERQHEARKARSYGDELGMVHIHLELEPHVGAPIAVRAEAEAQRLARAARAATTGGKGRGGSPDGDARPEPFERYLADAYAALLSGSGKGRAKRPELVVLVSHEVATRGWTKVKKGELCKIPGLGPVPPQVARNIAEDAFLNGVFFDGKDLRNLKRWSRDIPVEVQVALELGEPPGFDGVVCVDCGNRFRTEFDHVTPRSARGPTSHGNLKPRCWPCHQRKTAEDRRTGKLRPGEP